MPILLCAFLSLISCSAKEQPKAATRAVSVDATKAPQAAAKPAAQPADPAGDCRTYKGMINKKLAVTMRLCRVGDSLVGAYQYVKYGKDIRLAGAIATDGSCEIAEVDSKQYARFVGTLSGGVFEGVWTAEADQELWFHLEEVGRKEGNGAVDFSGNWSMAKDGYTFDLDLKQSGTTITGKHCAVTKNATHVDCSMGQDAQEPTIEGTVDGSSATVIFKSTFGLDSTGAATSGTARIEFNGKTISWKVIEVSGNDYWLPREAVMRRGMNH